MKNQNSLFRDRLERAHQQFVLKEVDVAVARKQRQEAIVDALNAGMTGQEIAEIVGVSRQRINALAKDYESTKNIS